MIVTVRMFFSGWVIIWGLIVRESRRTVDVAGTAMQQDSHFVDKNGPDQSPSLFDCDNR